MTTFVVVPCHFVSGAAWSRVAAAVQARGHQLLSPDPTGWGEQRALVAPEVGLNTHVAELAQRLISEDLREVALVGHSYGGMVIAGAVAHVPERVRRLIFLDAPVPGNVDTLFDHVPDAIITWYREQAQAMGHGWLVPPPDLNAFGLTQGDRRWLEPMLAPIPLRTCEQPLDAPGEAMSHTHRAYVWCRQSPLFASVAARLRKAPAWSYREIESGHLPMVTDPHAVADALISLDGEILR